MAGDDAVFWCFICRNVLDMRRIRSGACQGHILTEFAQCQKAIDETKGVAIRVIGDIKYHRDQVGKALSAFCHRLFAG